ncbi:MAG: DUF952 domain-containing protein [Pseudomonadota bacterium]
MKVYKIVPKQLWRIAEAEGSFHGAPVDLADGFIHFSTGPQLRETAAKHFRGGEDLLLVAFDADALGSTLKWEPSRGGALFPHLYRPLDPDEALWRRDLPLGPDGQHRFPPEADDLEASSSA